MKKMVFHFLNVGHGDCTFVELPSGRLMLIDINNSKALSDPEKAALAASRGITAYEFSRPGSYAFNKSWEEYYKSLLVDPYDYYVEHFGTTPVFRHIQTHPDMDHMSGLHNFYWVKQVGLSNFWDVAHAKSKTADDFPAGGKHAYEDWLVYELLRSGHRPNPYNPDLLLNDLKVMNVHRFNTGNYWTDDSISILSPTPELVKASNEAENWNDLSYVLRFEFGGRSVILAGDAEQAAWQSMLDNVPAKLLNCDVLKASHHGRKSGYHEDAVAAMDPHVVICSIGKKPDNADAHEDYKNQGAQVFSTRNKGTMVATIWEDGEVWVKDASGERLAELPILAKGTLSYA